MRKVLSIIFFLFLIIICFEVIYYISMVNKKTIAINNISKEFTLSLVSNYKNTIDEETSIIYAILTHQDLNRTNMYTIKGKDNTILSVQITPNTRFFTRKQISLGKRQVLHDAVEPTSNMSLQREL